jgi:hypothetical protein
MAEHQRTTVLAVWGALVSTGLAALKINEYLKDRPRLKVTIQPSMKAFPNTSAYGTMTVLLAKVANIGRRPTTITHVSLMLPRGRGYVLCADPITATYPVELSENKVHSFVFNQDALVKDYGLTPSQFVVCADDAAGRRRWSHGPLARVWKLHRRY